MNIDPLLNQLDAQALRLAQREYGREGIEMFLALENLRDPSSRVLAGADGPALAQLVERIGTRLMAARPDDPVRALRNALELAAHFDFGQPVAAGARLDSNTAASERLDPNVTGSGRSPLRLASDAQSGAAQLVHAIRDGRFIRSVNYHNTLLTDEPQLEAQLAALAERFVAIDLAQLQKLLEGEAWTEARPPLLLVFYEGFRNHFDVAAPLLEELGLTAIFCLIPGFIDAPVATQIDFGKANYLGTQHGEYADGRAALTWDEARELAARGHSFICHTMSHSDSDAPDANLRYEGVAAVERTAAMLGQPVKAFVWRKGPEWGVAPRADALLRAAGVELLVSNFKVQRLP